MNKNITPAYAYQRQAVLLWDESKMCTTRPELAIELRNLAFDAARQADAICGLAVNKLNTGHKKFNDRLDHKLKVIALRADVEASNA